MNISQIKNTMLRRIILIVGIPLFVFLSIVLGAALGIWQFAIETVKDWRDTWCRVVSTLGEYADALEEAAANGMRVACISNAGLDPPKRRVTFLPAEIFLKPGDVKPPRRAPVNVRDWLRDHT